MDKFNMIIEERYKEQKARVKQRVLAQTEIEEDAPKKSSAHIWRIGLVAASVCVAALAVALPLTLSGDAPASPAPQAVYSVLDCTYSPVNTTIKQMSLASNNGMLYLDNYDGSHYVTTCEARPIYDRDTVSYYMEIQSSKTTGERITLYVFDAAAVVDLYSNAYILCDYIGKKSEYRGTEIRYYLDGNNYPQSYIAVFGHGDYNYYMRYQFCQSDAELIAVISGMLDAR